MKHWTKWKDADMMDAEARIERLEVALEQIAVCCTDNMGPTCDHRMALDFVRQVANDACGQSAPAKEDK